MSEQQFVLLNRGTVDHLLTMLRRSENYCSNARPTRYPIPKEDLYAEPTEFYSGASGYAGATMREVIYTLESAMDN